MDWTLLIFIAAFGVAAGCAVYFAAAKSRAEALLEAERSKHDDMQSQFEEKFTLLASEALGRNRDDFLKLVSERFEKHKSQADQDLEARRKAIEALTKPIGETLNKFEKRVGEIEKAREGAYGALSEQVKAMAEGQLNLRNETGRLVAALRRPQTRGRWGERQLRNVLELAGMKEHVDFFEQESIEGEEGRLRPDVIIRLPGGKSIVVDAKTPLDAYLNAASAESEESHEEYLNDHLRQVRAHINQLGSKEYWKAMADAPDFVVMFVPGEAFYAAAMERDPELFEYAVKRKVVVTSPTNLIALVKAIDYGWRQDKLAREAQGVADSARDLYERLRTFGGYVSQLGDSLRQATKRYNSAVGSLETRVLPSARRFEELGVVASGNAIEGMEPVEMEPRELQAKEFQPDSEPKPKAEDSQAKAS